MDLYRFIHWDNSLGVFTLGSIGFCFAMIFIIGFIKTRIQSNKLSNFLENNK